MGTLHRIAGVDAALLDRETDDRRLLSPARLRVPRDVERRLEWKGVPPRLDRGDPHHSPP